MHTTTVVLGVFICMVWSSQVGASVDKPVFTNFGVIGSSRTMALGPHGGSSALSWRRRRRRRRLVMGHDRISQPLDTASRPATLSCVSSILEMRGGMQEDEDEYDNEDKDEGEDGEESDQERAVHVGSSSSSSSPLSSVLNVFKRVVVFGGSLTWRGVKASGRALQAAFVADDNDDQLSGGEGEGSSAVARISSMIKRMFRAAFHPTDPIATGTTEEVNASVDRKRSSSRVTTSPKIKPDKRDSSSMVSNAEDPESLHSHDFASFLAKSYNVEATRHDLDDVAPVLGGTIGEALRIARSQAKMLFILIPHSRPGKGGKQAVLDEQAVEGFLSAEVAAVAETKARKSEETGSFLLWSAKAGSPEAIVAIKRLKAQQKNSKGQKRPILMVAYPSQAVDHGGAKIVPKLVAQHHCTPPPSSETMAAWLNALRKRHAKQYASMQRDVREVQLYQDRKEGYKDSVKSDRDRRERERREEQQRVAQAKAEQEKLEAIQQRREALRDSLPDEPAPDILDAKTIALRLPDGRSAKRRFAPDTDLEVLFNWVDVTFDMERENVVLTTMNGQKSFEWEEHEGDLDSAGLGRMTGLRVTQK